MQAQAAPSPQSEEEKIAAKAKADSDRTNAENGARAAQVADAKRDDDSFWTRTGRFTYGLLGGAEFADSDENFSKAVPYIVFSGETYWGPQRAGLPTALLAASAEDAQLLRLTHDDESGWSDFHTWIAIKADSIPTNATDPNAPTKTVLESEKALTLATALEWRPWRCARFAQGDKPEDCTQSALTLGPLIKGGIQTLTDDPGAGQDSVNNYWGIGFRIAETEPRAFLRRDTPLLRCVDVFYGEYEALDDPKITIEGTLRLSEKSGFFVGFRTVLGSGDDDVRLVAGLGIDLSKLESAVRGLAGTVAGNSN